MTKRISSLYLVAKHLMNNDKSYIHSLKKSTRSNNPMQRLLILRRRYSWEVETVYEGYKDGICVYHYKLIKEGKMPKKYLP